MTHITDEIAQLLYDDSDGWELAHYNHMLVLAQQILDIEPIKTLLGLWERTQEECPTCQGYGKLQIPADGKPTGLIIGCNDCTGIGKTYDVGRLVVKAKDQSLPYSRFNGANPDDAECEMNEQKFWEACGVDFYENDNRLWARTPSGGAVQLLLDLNSLFKYAVPKVERVERMLLLVAWAYEVYPLEELSIDPAQALYKALYPVLVVDGDNCPVDKKVDHQPITQEDWDRLNSHYGHY